MSERTPFRSHPTFECTSEVHYDISSAFKGLVLTFRHCILPSANNIAATSELSPQGQFFEEQFKQAWKFFDEGSFDEANELSQWLLSEPRLSNLHKAGLHLILAHSPDEYVFHAKEAIRLYESLYEPGEEMARNQKKSIDTLLFGARRVLSQCEADEKELSEENASYTEGSLQDDISAAVEDYTEAEQKAEEALEAEEQAGDAVEEGGDTEMEEPAVTGVEEYEEEHEDSTPLLPTPPRSRGTEF